MIDMAQGKNQLVVEESLGVAKCSLNCSNWAEAEPSVWGESQKSRGAEALIPHLIFRDRRFRPLFWTQFFGALNDNYLKNALVIMIAYQGVSLWGLDHKSLVALAGGIFILPFVLFSALAGQLADCYPKHRIMRLTKLWEVFIMILASMAFYLDHFSALMYLLVLMGLQSTFFGPIKRGIIPDLVKDRDLVGGNAAVEMGTVLAILIGTIAGGLAAASDHKSFFMMTGLLSFALVGLAASWLSPPVPVADPQLKIRLNPIPEVWGNLKRIWPRPDIFNSILGVSWFWMFGSILLSLLPVYTKDLLFTDESVITSFLASFTLGVAIGAVLCARLSFGRVELGLVPIASLGLTVFALALWHYTPQLAPPFNPNNLMPVGEFLKTEYGLPITLSLMGLSISGGLFIVPLYTLIQQRSPAEYRSRIIATSNIINSFFMLMGAALLMALYALGFSVPDVFIILAVLNLGVAIYLYFLVPEFTLRLWSWLLVNLLYRLKVRGQENIPESGPALLICNHVSYVDWLIIAGGIRRPVRFVMDYKMAQRPWFRWILKQAKVIPIAPQKESPEILASAYAQISEALQAGDLVCLFPEGKLTRDGEVQDFKMGVERILAQTPVPVVPLALKGLWGSFFSHREGPALRKLPRRFWHRVGLHIGQSLPPSEMPLRAEDLRDRVKQL